MNPANASHKTAVKPRTEMAQGLRETVAPVSNEKLEQASQPLDAGLLCHKLNLVLKQIEKNEKQEKFNRSLSDKLSVLPHMEEDDQSILDLHMERVFSPYSTPGNISPKHLNSRYHHRSSEMSTPIPDFGKKIITNKQKKKQQQFFILKLLFMNNFFIQLLKLCDIQNQFRSMHQLACSVVQRVN